MTEAEYLENIKRLDSIAQELFADARKAMSNRNDLIVEAYDEGLSMASIGKVLGCTRQNVRQIVLRELNDYAGEEDD